jgi:class 3 adenylate cyclase
LAEPPTGTVTFLFTDIEGSIRLWEKSPEWMQGALARHDEILHTAIEAHEGFIFKITGEAFCAAFPTASDALAAALTAQKALRAQEWGEDGEVRVRMALHTGAADQRGGDYFGPPVNGVARLLSGAHGGHVLLSLATREMIRDQLPTGAELRDLREHRFKDLFRLERVFQLVTPDLPAEFSALEGAELLSQQPSDPTHSAHRAHERD